MVPWGPHAWGLYADDGSTLNVDASRQTQTSVTNTSEQGAHGSGTVGATVTRDRNSITVSGIASAVGVVDNQRVTGDASGTLRISWGGNNRNRRASPVSPPGAPELPAPFLFGTGLGIFGFGLMITRRRW